MSDEGWKTFPQWTACQALNEGPKWQVPKTMFLTRYIEEKENKTKTKKGKWGGECNFAFSMAFFAIP